MEKKFMVCWRNVEGYWITLNNKGVIDKGVSAPTLWESEEEILRYIAEAQNQGNVSWLKVFEVTPKEVVTRITLE